MSDNKLLREGLFCVIYRICIVTYVHTQIHVYIHIYIYVQDIIYSYSYYTISVKPRPQLASWLGMQGRPSRRDTWLLLQALLQRSLQLLRQVLFWLQGAQERFV